MINYIKIITINYIKNISRGGVARGRGHRHRASTAGERVAAMHHRQDPPPPSVFVVCVADSGWGSPPPSTAPSRRRAGDADTGPTTVRFAVWDPFAVRDPTAARPTGGRRRPPHLRGITTSTPVVAVDDGASPLSKHLGLFRREQ
jgi:hypothetical protein